VKKKKGKVVKKSLKAQNEEIIFLHDYMIY